MGARIGEELTTVLPSTLSAPGILAAESNFLWVNILAVAIIAVAAVAALVALTKG